VNSSTSSASNREVRRIEAEQDRALIDQARRGDAQAFRRLVERHQRRAFAIAVGLVRDEQDALEVVQEAFLRVHRGLERFNGGSTFFTWLYRIVTNLSIDLMRRPARRECGTEPVPDTRQGWPVPLLAELPNADPAEGVRRAEIACRIDTALASLPHYHRAVILMREIEGLSYEEMAQVLGVSKGTIMSRLFHARQKLQRALSDYYREEVGEPTAERHGRE
jgi:RNA polymerase sigma-70 factor (ECF subfamily)